MAKLNKEDFKTKYSDNAPSEELDELKSKLEKSENDFNDLKEKYKQRFLSPADVKKADKIDEIDSFEEPQEKKFIDVKIEDL